MTAVSIKVGYDETAAVFFVRESDVVGLNVEEPTMHRLLATLRELVPVPLKANGATRLPQVKLVIETEIDPAPSLDKHRIQLKLPQNRWMRAQASSRACSEVA